MSESSLKYSAQAFRKDAPQIERLRLAAYRSSRVMELSDEKILAWSNQDDSGFVFAIWEKNECIATMRANVVFAEEQLKPFAFHEESAGFCSNFPGFPAVVLGRAATASAWSGQGLNSLLRLFFLQWAKKHEAKTVIGEISVGAPRTRLLSRLGWQSRRSQSSHGTRDLLGTEIVLLNLERDGDETIAKLEKLTLQIAEVFPWRGGNPKFPSLPEQKPIYYPDATS